MRLFLVFHADGKLSNKGKQTPLMTYFLLIDLGAVKSPENHVTGSVDNAEISLIIFILLLWLYVIRIFLQKWGELAEIR